LERNFWGRLAENPISEPLLNYYIMLESKATARSTQECAKSFATTDFRIRFIKNGPGLKKMKAGERKNEVTH
jgi:hypothetical protein